MQASGCSAMSPTTIIFPSSKKILVDGLKKATVQEFRLRGVNACDLIVSATSGGDGFSADLAVETLSCGKSIEAPLFIRLPAKPGERAIAAQNKLVTFLVCWVLRATVARPGDR